MILVCRIGFINRFATLIDHPEIYVLGGQIAIMSSGNIPYIALEKELLRWNMLLNISVIAHPTAMINRQVLISLGKYPEDYLHVEDHALWNILYFHFEFPIANLPYVLIYYRIHDNNVSVKNKCVQQDGGMKCQLELLKYEFNIDIDEKILNYDEQFSPIELQTSQNDC